MGPHYEIKVGRDWEIEKSIEGPFAKKIDIGVLRALFAKGVGEWTSLRDIAEATTFAAQDGAQVFVYDTDPESSLVRVGFSGETCLPKHVPANRFVGGARTGSYKWRQIAGLEVDNRDRFTLDDHRGPMCRDELFATYPLNHWATDQNEIGSSFSYASCDPPRMPRVIAVRTWNLKKEKTCDTGKGYREYTDRSDNVRVLLADKGGEVLGSTYFLHTRVATIEKYPVYRSHGTEEILFVPKGANPVSPAKPVQLWGFRS